MESTSFGEADIPPLTNPNVFDLPLRTALAPQYVIAPEEITADRDSLLGRGTASVFRGFWNNSLVAIKMLSSEAQMDTLVDRVQTWQALRHPHLLQVFGVCSSDSNPPFIISQYYPDGNANEFLLRNPGADRARIMFECALGMQYLHARGIVHGGLRPTNILIAENGQVCISDYGMIEIQPSGNPCAHRYFSPEAWKGTISKPADVYAFAMSCYEIFTSSPPWGVLSENRIYHLVVHEGDRPDRLDHDVEQKHGLTDWIWEIMTTAWQQICRQRPTFTQIVELWQSRSAEGGLNSSRPMSLSGNVPGSSSSLQTAFSFHSSQSIRLSSQTRRSSGASDAASLPGLPPPYRESAGKKTSSYRSFSVSSTVSTDPTINANPRDGIIADAPRSFSPPPIVGYEVPNTPPTSRDTDTDPMINATPDSSPRPTQLLFSDTGVPPVQLSRPPRKSFVGKAELVTNRLISHTHIIPENQDVPNIEDGESLPRRSPTQLRHRPFSSQGTNTIPETQSSRQEIQRVASTSSTSGRSTAVLLAGALHAEVTEGRKQDVINDYLHRAQLLCSQCSKDAQRLVTAGIVPTVILLLRARALDAAGLEIVLITLGILACDPITANTISRTNTTSTLIDIINSSDSDNVVALSAWCINRICRNAEVATGLIKQDLAKILIQKGLKGNLMSSCSSAWCLGIMAYTDSLAETLAGQDIVVASVDHLRKITSDPEAGPEDQCAAMYVIARVARSISLSKSFINAGCANLIVHHLSTSEDPQVLHWSARAMGCLIRPNAGNIAKALLEAGAAKALARMPRVLSTEQIDSEPLASFAFAIQRFSVAEWGSGTRKALVDAGVADSLLSALRTSADEPLPQVHIELALAVSFLGDVGGTSIRKEIIRAGGVDILKRVASTGKPDVAKACNMAVTSITGNLWSRNAASARTAMSHNWSGGCPEYQPPCPLSVTAE